MSRIFKRALWVALVSLVAFSPLFSAIQESRILGGKATGKGGALTADNNGVASPLFNPAGLSLMSKDLGFFVAYGNPYEEVGDLNLLEAAFVTAYNLNVVQLGLTVKSSGSYSVVSYNNIYLTAAKKLSLNLGFLNWVSLGANLKLVNIHAANIPANITFASPDGFGFSFDIGMQTALFDQKLILGVNGRNLYSTKVSLITDGVGDEMSREIYLGLKYNITDFFNLTADYRFLYPEHTVSYLNLFGDSFSFANLFVGMEFDYFENVKVYTGFNEGSVTLGVGVTDANLFQVDAGIWVVPGLKLYSQVSVSFQFGKASSVKSEDALDSVAR